MEDKNVESKSMDMHCSAALAMNEFDAKRLTKEELEKIVQIDFKTGESDNKTWKNLPYAKAQILIQLCDKELISEDIMRKQVFGIERKEENKVVS